MRVIILLFITVLSRVVNSTVDISAEAYHFIVNNLTIDECRKLVASLHFVSDDLPDVLQAAKERIPVTVSCYDLLIYWNVGKEKWQGWGKSHEIVARRLRQMGHEELARRLSVMVFHKLAEDINETTINFVYEDHIRDKLIPKRKLLRKTYHSAYKYWEIYDSVLWVAILILSVLTVFSCCRIIYMACRNLIVGKIKREDEFQYLLKDRFACIELDS